MRDTLEETIIDRISQQLNFSSIWAYPVRSAPFSTIVRNLLNEAEATLSLLGRYVLLVENGIQSPFFNQIVQGVLAIMAGGGDPSG